MPGLFFEFFGAAEQAQFKSYLQQYGSDPVQSGFIKSMISSIKDVRMGIMKADVMRSLLFVVIAMAAVFAFAMKKLKAVPALIVLGVLITVDLWEHAYYIDYRNLRPSYMEAFWALANWEFASANFAG